MSYIQATARHLRRQPLDSLLAILSLTVGIGFAGAVFSVANAFFFKSLPLHQPDRLAVIYGLDAANPGFLPISFPNFEDITARREHFSEFVSYQWTGANLVGFETPERLTGQIVSERFFQLLGVVPASGRAFVPEDHNTVILAHRLASKLHGGDPGSALGEVILLGRQSFEVVGIAPKGFVGVGAMGLSADFWVPMNAFDQVSRFGAYKDVRRARMFGVVGRLHTDASIEAAARDMSNLAASLRDAYPDANGGLDFAVRPLNQSILDPNKRDRFVLASRLLALLGALLLAMVCANVSHLLLIRAGQRARDHAIRQALGASAGHIAWVTMAESLLLAVIGGAFGAVVAIAVQRLVWHARPSSITVDSFQLGFDFKGGLFVLVTVLLTGVLSSLGPILGTRRRDLVSVLKLGPAVAGEGATRFGMRDILVGLQITVALVALAGVGLFVRSLDRASRFDLGVASDKLVLFRYDLRGEEMDAEGRLAFGRRLVERVETLPGVAAASLASFPPLNPFLPLKSFEPEGEAELGEAAPAFGVNAVDDDYFTTAGIALLEGRGFGPADRAGTDPVAVVNRTLARRFWRDEQALGKRFRLGTEQQEVLVVGVVADSVFGNFGEEVRPLIFVPLAQEGPTGLTLHVRAVGSPAILVNSVPKVFEQEAPNVPLTNIETMADRLKEALWAPRLAAVLVSVVGMVSIVLAIIGVYGAVGASVRQRRREIGIRIAIGGPPKRVVWQLVRRSARGVAVGLLAGLVVAALALQLTRNLLFGISPLDPVSLIGAAGLLAVTAMIAAVLPAYFAVRADPVSVLREP